MGTLIQHAQKVLSGFLALFLVFQPLAVLGFVAYNYTDNPYVQNVSGFRNNISYGNSSTGAFTMSVPVVLPQGVNGMTPSLDLGYSSQTKDEHNLFGFGWSISIPSITVVNRSGVESMYDDNHYSSSMAGVLEYATTTVGGVEVYYPETQTGSVVRYEKENSQWRATDTQGNEYVFGEHANARVDDPQDPGHVHQWNMTSQSDRFGNTTTYTYTSLGLSLIHI